MNVINGKYELDWVNACVTRAGVKVCDLYEPQALVQVPEKGVVIALGHEELKVIDINTAKVIKETYIR
jgi:hypothetical protein